jgi:hypothetical protein
MSNAENRHSLKNGPLKFRSSRFCLLTEAYLFSEYFIRYGTFFLEESGLVIISEDNFNVGSL